MGKKRLSAAETAHAAVKGWPEKVKKGVVIAAVLLLAAALVGGFFAWRSTRVAVIRGPEVRELEQLLMEQSDCVTGVRITVSRPTAEFTVYVKKDGDGDELLALAETISGYINDARMYETVLTPRFRMPHIWADGIQITFSQGWGPFARAVQQYSCSYGSAGYSYEEIAEMGFHQWRLEHNSFDPDGELQVCQFD